MASSFPSVRPAPQSLPLSLRGALLVIATVTGASLAAGWLIADGKAAVVAALIGAAALPVAFRRYPGPTAALLLLAVMNGLPLLDLSGRLPGGAHYQDGAVVLFAALLFFWRAQPVSPRHARLTRLARRWSAVFVAYWVFTLVRSVLVYDIPVVKAVLYGRDFLYFAVILPLALGACFPPGALRAGIRVLVAGVCTFAVGVILTSAAGANVSWLVHPLTVSVTNGVSRVYSSMGDLVNTTLILTAALLLSHYARRRRLTLTCLAGLLLIASLLQLTRANYFALAIAVLVSGYVYMARYATAGSLVLRGLAVILAVVALALSIHGSSGTSGTDTSAAGAVVSRVESSVSTVTQSSGTLGYRESVDSELLRALGSSWPVGLSFLHPAAHYVVGVPQGTIRNSDTGVLNVVMTMGVLGAVLLYAPLLYGGALLLRSTRRASQGEARVPPWVAYAAAAWIGWAIAGSPTLVLLFSVSGLTLSGLVLAAIGQALSTGRVVR